jgi:ABC-type sugar transport system permease subunit
VSQDTLTADRGVGERTAPTPRRRGVTSPLRRVRQLGPWWFLLPAVLVLGVFVGYPILRTLWMSLHEWSLSGRSTTWVGFGNYRALFTDDRFWNAVRVTFVYTGFAVVMQTVIGLGLAQRLRRTTRWTKLLRSAYFFPTIAALATMGLVWRFILDPQIGLVNGWLEAAAIVPPQWLRDTQWALPTIIAVGIWKNVGFTMIVLVSAIQDVPAILEEAAWVDGANAWQRFRHVVLPSIRPALLFVSVINTIASLQMFDLVFAMTRGGPLFSTETLVSYMYERGFERFDFGYAAAVSWMLFLVVMIFSVVQLKFFGHDDD